MVRQKKAPAARRRPMSREEALARQERQQRRRELEQESRELAKGLPGIITRSSRMTARYSSGFARPRNR